MNLETITQLLIQYRYLILFPLAAFEGPIVALIAGFLWRAGYIAALPAYGILILGDIIPDSFYFYVGRFGNRGKFAEKYTLRFRTVFTNFKIIEKLWQNHPKKTMFFSKLAYGLSIPFLISAGLVNMPYKKFISYAIPVTLFQYGVIMAFGYFIGHSYLLAAQYIEQIYVVIAVILILLIVSYTIISKYARKQIEKYD